MHTHASDTEDQVARAQQMSGDASSMRRPATGSHDEVRTSRPDTGRGHAPRPDGKGAPAAHTAHDESVVRGLLFSSMNSRAAKLDAAAEAERFAKNPHRQLESDVSRELQTGVPGTFGVRHLRPGETLHARSDPDRDNAGHYSSPEALGREEAVQGHALAWTGVDRSVQHSRAHTYEVTRKGGGPVLMSKAAAQDHKTHQIDGAAEHLSGGREQYMHPQGLYGSVEEQGAKGLAKKGDALDGDVEEREDGTWRQK
jgi:hypothetical protein